MDFLYGGGGRGMAIGGGRKKRLRMWRDGPGPRVSWIPLSVYTQLWAWVTITIIAKKYLRWLHSETCMPRTGEHFKPLENNQKYEWRNKSEEITRGKKQLSQMVWVCYWEGKNLNIETSIWWLVENTVLVFWWIYRFWFGLFGFVKILFCQFSLLV